MKNRLVAHRGDMTHYVENTLRAIQAAIDLNMSWIEVDIQISKDGTPIVVHDNDLSRIAGINKNVTGLMAAELAVLPIVLESDEGNSEKMPTLAKVVELLNEYTDITLFVEVKKESVAAFDLQKVMTAVASVLDHARFPVVIISFLSEIAELAKSLYSLPMGWVVTDFDDSSWLVAERLQPEFIFCNVTKVKQIDDLWPGNWRWVLYDIKDPQQAHEWMQSPQVMIETGDIVKLMGSPWLE